jgi:hypothetical protein
LKTHERNGTATAAPRRIGSVPYTSPAGRPCHLEHWVLADFARRWYARRGDLYAADGGFFAPTIAGAAGCATVDLAKELVSLIERSEEPGKHAVAYAGPGGTITQIGGDSAPPPRAPAAESLPSVWTRPGRPLPPPPPAALLFRPFRDDQTFVLEERPGVDDRPWTVSHEGRQLRADELGLQPEYARPWAEFATAHAAQEAVLAMLEARRRPRAADPPGTWTATFRPAAGGGG